MRIKEKKQIKAIQDQGHVKTIKKYDYDDEDSPLISKQKEIFNELADERLKKITELDEKVNRKYIDTKVKILIKNLINMKML